LNGLRFPQEYLCIDHERFRQPLYVYTILEDIVIADISTAHSFVGYSPVIVGIRDEDTTGLHPEKIRIAFTAGPLDLNDTFRSKDALSILFLEKIKSQRLGDDETLLYYAATRGVHHFVSGFSRLIIRLSNRLYQKKTGNVYLPGNSYKQVQIAYAVPRNISLITVSRGGLFNLFPTDLHGPAGEDHYIISLRHEGKACKQVMETGKILLTAVDSGFYKTVYSLGKNHMQEMKKKEHFPFSDRVSTLFQLPLPAQAVSYRELELAESFTYGIHRVFLFKTVARQRLQDFPSTLAHIHTVYATWRQNKGLTGNYLLR
jgi:flavin reductase (DIM6/NTAB) family NADH-FMN oxidoreductase RutF